MASIVFAEIVIAALVFKGYSNVKDQVRMTSLAGIIAAVGLGLVYGGLMYLGATSSSIHPQSIERTDLLIAIAEGLMGGTGKFALGLAVSLACLTTSIGLTATVADYFSHLSRERLSYKLIAVITVVFSGVFATVGVTTIVQVAVPLLVTVYPVAIALIILTMIGRPVADRTIYAGAVVGALLTSVPDALTAAGLPIAFLNRAVAAIPFSAGGFAWMIPTVVGALVGWVLVRTGRSRPIPAVAEQVRPEMEEPPVEG